jgi:hypothetical protein
MKQRDTPDMKPPERKLSLRMIRKGAFVEETYAAFRTWDLALSFKQNIEKIRMNNPMGAGNEKWLHEIVSTLSSRFKSHDTLSPLVILAQADWPVEIWKFCLLWHIGSIDALYYRFAVDWLFPHYHDGAIILRTADVQPFVRAITRGKIASGGDLTDYGELRTARDLLKMASEFGLLKGKVMKRFVDFHIPREAFVYVLYGLTEMGNSTAQILNSDDWKLFFMDRQDVEREIFRLHQYKILEYHVAGSIAQLSLPEKSLQAYARSFLS